MKFENDEVIALIDAVENVLTAYSMGQDLEGVMTHLKDVLLENWRASDADADVGADDRRKFEELFGTESHGIKRVTAS